MADETPADVQLAAALLRLRDSERRQTFRDVTAILAHEIGTPLNVIAGRAAMLAGDQSASALAQKNARIIAEQAQVLTALLQHYLAIVPTPVEAAVPLEPSLSRARAATTSEIACEAEPDLRVRVDADRLLAVLLTLLTTVASGRLEVTAVTVDEPADPRAAPGQYVRLALTSDDALTSERLGVFSDPYLRQGGEELPLRFCHATVRSAGGFIVAQPGCIEVHLPRGGEA